MEQKTFDALKLVPPTPPCGNCRRERVYWDCYRDCYRWLDYALEYQAFVRRRDEVKKARVKEAVKKEVSKSVKEGRTRDGECKKERD